jgi:hypothetical protein
MSAAIYRSAVFLFSILCYGVFLLVFLYLLAFLGNVQVAPLVSKSIDLGRDMGSPAIAVLIDVGLILLFGLQHSVMARPGFKRLWTRVVPTELERSAYVLIASAVLALLMWQWRPIPTPVLWHADAAWSVALGWSVMILGVFVLLWATFLIDHFELFGLQQGWSTLRSEAARARIRHAVSLQDRASSDLPRLAADLLGRADHDRGSSVVCGGHERLHPSGHALRGARPRGAHRRAVPTLSTTGAGARASTRQTLQRLDVFWSYASTMRRNRSWHAMALPRIR